MATPPDGALEETDWIEEGKIKRRKHKMDMKNGVGHTIDMWTINTGGLQGTWRVVNLIGDMEKEERPCLICIQESSCTGSAMVETPESHEFSWLPGISYRWKKDW